MNLMRSPAKGDLKPPAGAVINWSHPLADGLVCCMLPEGNFASQTDRTGFNPPMFPTTAGTAMIGRQAATGHGFQPNQSGVVSETPLVPAGMDVALTNRSTILMRGVQVFASTAATGVTWGCVDVTVATKVPKFVIPTSPPDSVGIRIQSTNYMLSNVGLGSRLFRPLQFTATSDWVAGHSVLYDGARAVASDATTGTWTVGQARYGIGGGGTTTGFVLSMGCVWKRPLSPDEVAWLAYEPYAFFAPPGPKIFYLPLAPPAGGGVTTNQTVSVSQTQTPSRVLSVGKQVAATQTQTPSSTRSIAKTLTAAATQVPTAVKQIAKHLAVTNAQTASLTAQAAKVMIFAVTQTQTAAVVKQVAKRLAVTQTQTPTNQRAVGKVITATETQTPTARRQVGKTIAVTHTQTPAMQRTIGKILGAVQHAVATLISTTVGLSIAIGDHFYMALETNKVSGVEAGGVHVVSEAQVFYHTDPDEQEETT